MNSQVRAYLTTNFLCLLGVWFIRIAIAWLAWELTKSYFWLGMVAAVQLIPTFVLSPIAGALADRMKVSRPLVMILAGLLATTATIAVSTAAGYSHIYLLAVQATCIGVCTAVYLPMRLAMLKRIADSDGFAKLVIVDSLSFNITRLVGPALAGIVIASQGVTSALLIGIIGHLPLVFSLMWISRQEEYPAIRGSLSMRAGLAEAAEFARNTPTVLTPLLLTGVNGFFVRGVVEQFPALADGLFNRGATGAGQLLSASGMGAVIAASLLLLVRKEEVGRSLTWLFALALLSNIALPFISTESWFAALGTAAFLGFTGAIIGVCAQVQIQVHTPKELQGRIVSFWTLLAIGNASLGALAVGWLADALTMRFSLIAATVGGILAVGLVALNRSRSAHYLKTECLQPDSQESEKITSPLV